MTEIPKHDSICNGVARRSVMLGLGGATFAAGLPFSGSAAPRSLRSDNEILDVAIIGAGLSGLTSARDLALAGCESFAVLEARERVGGRTVNHDIGNGVIAEGGGQWIGMSQTAIADLARELNVDTFESYYRGESVFLVDGKRVAQDVGNGGVAGNAAVTAKINSLAAMVSAGRPWEQAKAGELDRQSVAQWLSTQQISDEDKYTYDLAARLTFGAPAASLSLLYYLSVINSADCNQERLEAMRDGAQEKRFVGGSAILSEKIATSVGDKVRLATPVRKIVGWDRDIVEIHTDRGTVRARQIITALSPALCHQIAFDPPLPAGRAQMQQVWPVNGRMRKAVHVYKRPFWRDAGLNGQVTDVGGLILWSADNSPPDASVGIITAFVDATSTPTDPKDAQARQIAVLARALGEEALHPIQYHEIDWGTVDSWSLSCTSPYPPNFLTRWGRYIQPAVGRLIWSGTETADLWPGAMDGAVRAGHRSALHALRALSRT